jgi:hypothetical protein
MLVIIRKLLATALGRWVLGLSAVAIIGGAVTMWHSHKEGLREEGVQECVQEINQATLDQLYKELKLKDDALAEARRIADANRKAAMDAIKRRRAAEVNLELMVQAMEEQRENDETYRKWADTNLPGGVADRLRQAAGSSSDNSN